MRTALLALMITLSLAVAAPANAIDYPYQYRSYALEAKLPTPVAVYCTQNTSWSFAVLHDRQIFLAKAACDSLLHGKPSDAGTATSYPWSLWAHTLYHEWWHV